VHSGATVTFTLQVVNHGPGTAQNVQAVDDLPPGMIFVSATASTGTCTQSRNVVCSFGTLRPGQKEIAKITVRVQATSGVMDNVAIVTTPSVDTNAGNNKASAKVGVVATKAARKVLKAKPHAVHAAPKFTG
jgi:uncharacterized repeat protein (TIGR01451 family)